LHLSDEKNHMKNFSVIELTEIYFLILREIIFSWCPREFPEKKMFF